MASTLDNDPIAFRIGQIDALARTMLASSTLFSPEMRHSLALRWLRRAWHQYRTDRGINTGESLVGVDACAERNAFLGLLETALPSPQSPLMGAVTTVRKIALKPMAHEAQHTRRIIADSQVELDRVLEAFEDARLPNAPLERLLWLVSRFQYTTDIRSDALTATSSTPCWAINLAIATAASRLNIAGSALPCPGAVQRRLFRGDRDRSEQRLAAFDNLTNALHDLACDIVITQRANSSFDHEFPAQRSNSRLRQCWLLLFGLQHLTPSQLARGVGVTKAGAAKLLKELEKAHIAHSQGNFMGYACSIKFPVAFPDWRASADEHEDLSSAANHAH